MTGSTRIRLYRHGATEWSRSGRHTGITDIPLLPDGEAIAASMRSAVAAHEFARVFASPLVRARRTAELLGLGDRMEIDPDLAEWNYGDYEGVTTAEIRRSVPGWTVWSHPCPGGETGGEVAARCRRVIDRCLACDGDCAIVAHGHLLRVFAATWLGLPPSDGRFLALDTGTECVLGFEHEYRTIIRWNASPSSAGDACS